jgi:pyruvyl transferase EpsO
MTSKISGHDMATNKEIIKRLCNEIDIKLYSYISSKKQKVALVDFPNHSNVGDSAIVLGELEWFKKNDHLKLAYMCDIKRYDKNCLKNIVGDGIIFINGGGNFGDIWPISQQFREKIINDFPENRIIQFPQSIYYQSEATLEKSRETINNHKRFTLLVRDKRSFKFAKKNFYADICLCPDMAFYIGPLKRKIKSETNFAALIRTDKETMNSLSFMFPDDALVFDWIKESKTFDLRMNILLRKILLNYQTKFEFLNNLMTRSYANLARQRFERGCRLLEKGKVVCTDRLHGHIMSLLIGIPHFLSDNIYGKLNNFYSCWTHDCDITYMCTPDKNQIDISREAKKLGWIS